MIRKYDTWLWKTKYQDRKPKELNDLLYIYGRKRFLDTMIDKVINGDSLFSKGDRLLLDLQQEKIDHYVENKSRSLKVIQLDGLQCGVVFAEQFQSELGNRLSELNSKLDCIIIADPSKSVSYRTTKTGIDLGQGIAKLYGGGGHPQAAGSQITDNDREKILQLLFKY